VKIRIGDMWSAWDTADLFLITTNSTYDKDGCLVMGAGIAGQAAKRFPRLPCTLGERLRSMNAEDKGIYGLLVSTMWPQAKLGLFQTKRDWQDSASKVLVIISTNMLVEWANEHPDAQIHLNYPGIGKGNLSEEEVFPIIERLPENVTIWKEKL